MKLIIALAVVAFAHGDKLDKTYLPPSHAQSSGGSSFLQAPGSAPQFRGANNFARNNGFAQNDNGFAPSGNDFAPRGNGFAPRGNGFAQNDNGVAQNGNGFAQNGNGFAQSGNGFAQNGNGFAQNGNDYAQDGNGDYNVNFENRPERAQASFERNAAILRQDNSNDGETYSFAYETENGITAEENGVATNGVEAQGGYSYTGDDGQVYSIRYTAGQNGFVPEGDHLPTPPPVPEEILKALEQNARDEADGIYDDGSYKEGSYPNGAAAQDYNANFNGIRNQYPAQNDFGVSDDSVVVNSALLRSGLRNQGNDRNQGNERFQGNDRYQSNGAAGNNFGQAAGRSGSAVNKEYLPPVSQRNSNAFGSRNRQPTYNDRDGYRF